MAIQVANVGAPLAGKMVGKIVTGIGSHVTSDNSSTSYSYTPSSSALSSESIKIKETNSSNKLLGDSLDNFNLCQKSTILSEGNSIRWGGAFNSYVRTAKSRGLSEQDCARNLGLVKTADSISTSTDNLHQIATKTAPLRQAKQ